MSMSAFANTMVSSPLFQYAQWTNPYANSMDNLMNQAYSMGGFSNFMPATSTLGSFASYNPYATSSFGMANPYASFNPYGNMFSGNPFGGMPTGMPTTMPPTADNSVLNAWNDFLKNYKPSNGSNNTNTNTNNTGNTDSSNSNTGNNKDNKNSSDDKGPASSFDAFEFYTTLSKYVKGSEFSKEAISTIIDTKNLNGFEKSLLNFAFENFDLIDRNEDKVMVKQDIIEFAALAGDTKTLSTADSTAAENGGSSSSDPTVDSKYAKELETLVKETAAKEGKTGVLYDVIIDTLEYDNQDAGKWTRNQSQLSMDQIHQYQKKLTNGIEAATLKDASDSQKALGKKYAAHLSYLNFLEKNFESFYWAGGDKELSILEFATAVNETDDDASTFSSKELTDLVLDNKQGSRPNWNGDTYDGKNGTGWSKYFMPLN